MRYCIFNLGDSRIVPNGLSLSAGVSFRSTYKRVGDHTVVQSQFNYVLKVNAASHADINDIHD